MAQGWGLLRDFEPRRKAYCNLWSGLDCSDLGCCNQGGICPPLQHQEHIFRVRFSEDSKWLITSAFDCTARVWDAHTGEAITPPLRHPEKVWDAGFFKEGNSVWTRTDNGTKFVWDLLPVLGRSLAISH